MNDRSRTRESRESGTRRRGNPMDAHDVVDLNDTEWLRRFMTDYGKILPARLTGVNAAQQRQIKQGIRRARNIGLLP